MSKERLASSFMLRLGVTGIEKICGVVVVPLLVARLGVDGYGYYSLVLSLALIYSNVLTLRLPLAVIRFYPDDREKAGPVVLVGLLYWALVVAGATTLFLLCGKPIAAYAFAKPGMTRLLGASVGLGLASMLYEFVTITLRAENRFQFRSVVDVSERIAFLTVIELVFRLGSRSIEAVCLVLVVMTVVKVLAAIGPALKGLRWSLPDRRLAREMFVFSLPYLPYLASTW
ncbi:MAG: lipopolysaccharide biosynthesis protein, partial [Candidatus Dormibacteraceae bacterium]